MEVKDVKNIREGTGQGTNTLKPAFQKPAQTIATAVEPALRLEAAKVEVATKARIENSTELRAKANAIINVVNVASEATDEIDKLVQSISGIVDQVTDPKLSEQRKKVLENEANQLVKEIRRKAENTSAEGIKPLIGEKISLDDEKRLAKTLDIILPDGAKEAFGLGQIQFSPKDAIIQTRSTIAKARERLEVLKKAVDSSKEQAKNTVAELEVALQNTEASESSIRDLDQALKLASETKLGIGLNPNSALESVGLIDKKVISLLE